MNASIYVGVALLFGLLVVGLVLTLWLTLGRGPRRWRAYRRVQRFLHEGHWEGALQLLGGLEREPGLSEAWRGRFRNAKGEAHTLAVDEAVKQKQYDSALDHALAAAPLLGQGEDEARLRVTEAVLAEVRRLFSAGPQHTDEVLALCQKTHTYLGGPCPEGHFWAALCEARRGATDQAIADLLSAHEEGKKEVVDPPLYLGVLLQRQGRPQESLRYLADANRIGATCPFVAWQMGISLVASAEEGDPARHSGVEGGGRKGSPAIPLAVRALQKALGPRGLGLWAPGGGGKRPDNRVWVEAFPETRSYVRRLAGKHAFSCPVLGNDLAAIIRQGELALAQAYYRQGQFQEAADLFTRLLQESPPTVPLLRGLGLSLARLGRYDQAYKHLRTVLEEEQPKSPFTAGYLALCGALGRPTQEEDKPRNVAWALKLLARYPLSENEEWAGLLGRVHAEARRLNLEVGKDDQVLLCDTLASVHAADQQAGLAYAHLCRTFPEAVQPRYAWLYARSAVENHLSTDQDLPLFARVFETFRPAPKGPQSQRVEESKSQKVEEPESQTDKSSTLRPFDSGTLRPWEGPASVFFRQQGWDFDEVEFTYLERFGLGAPGCFPPPLGEEYPSRGEAFLLERSRQEEAAGRPDEARKAAEVLLRLRPESVAAHDHLARLHYRRGNREQALSLLAGWQRLEPNNPLPLLRQAVLAREAGQDQHWPEAIRHALGLAQGRQRAAVAFLGARLALQQAYGDGTTALSNGESGASAPEVRDEALERAREFLEVCLQDDPEHTEALTTLAALHAVRGAREELAGLAERMDRAEVPNPWFHFLGAVCHLARRDFARAVDLGQRATRAWEESTEQQRSASGLPLPGESAYLQAWAHLHAGDEEAAAQALQQVAGLARSPSVAHARALLGKLDFERGDYDRAVRWWTATDPARRAEWGLEETLRQTTLLAGLLALEEGRFEQAADYFERGRRLGLDDPRLGPLTVLALVRAGQRLLYQEPGVEESKGQRVSESKSQKVEESTR